jgi:hypothetical protein
MHSARPEGTLHNYFADKIFADEKRTQGPKTVFG